MFKTDQIKIGVVGLGYVGLPLAVEFGKKYPVVGFDLKHERVEELKKGVDCTRESSSEDIFSAERLTFSVELNDLATCNVYIVTVPTPVDHHKLPDFSSLVSASESIGKILNPNDVVIYESTVYPGATEEICVPILERSSDLIFNRDFFAGYSPERINPGDKERRLTNIVKITSGSTPEVAEFVDELYRSILEVETHKASSIRVAEAAKVIENTQRDVNIALVNELAKIFNRLGIDTLEVLEAAGTKWNFLPFRPGLVGGHCIGVDPYYLTFKAQEVGYYPEMILAERRINDGMGTYIAEQVMQLMLHNRVHVCGGRILIMGLTFKENCPDLRNNRVVDIIEELKKCGAQVDVFDPWANVKEAAVEFGLELTVELQREAYDAIVVAVAHEQFRQMGGTSIREFGKDNAVLYDVKRILPNEYIDGGL